MSLQDLLAQSIALHLDNPAALQQASKEAAETAVRKARGPARRRLRDIQETPDTVTVHYYSFTPKSKADYSITLDKNSGSLSCTCPDCTKGSKKRVLAFLTSPAQDLCKHQQRFRAWWLRSGGRVAR